MKPNIHKDSCFLQAAGAAARRLEAGIWKQAQSQVGTANPIQVSRPSRGGPAGDGEAARAGLCARPVSGPDTYFHYQAHIPGIPG